MKKIVTGILICILFISTFFLGKHVGSAESAVPSEEVTAAKEATEPNLRISFDNNIQSSFRIPLEQGNYRCVTCHNIENVTIEAGGITMKLEDALQEGHISVDEMIALARQDASMGFCNEVAKSKNGVTVFTYHYQEFRLRCVYDLYETPDGGRHLSTGCMIYGNGSEPQFFPGIDDTGRRIDYEDWGLLFEVLKSDPDSITINCSQSGGQQIGSLIIEDSMLYKKNYDTNDLERIELLPERWNTITDNESDYWELNPDQFLSMDGTKELHLDFTQLYGQLCAGEYLLCLKIADQYNEEDVHPLMRNYYDAQWYEIIFTIE